MQLGRRLDQAGVTEGLDVSSRKPEWMRVKLRTDPEYLRLKHVSRELDLVTVCEEAGCPNIFECWNEGTATFMLLGERCTRSCGFCLIDTQKPVAPDPEEPTRIADAVVRLGLDFAVLTMVARDDLDDGGATHVAATVRAIRAAAPEAGIEVLISDLKGDRDSLDLVLRSRPTIVNHNIETVARLQRAVRPSAGYARSLASVGAQRRVRPHHEVRHHRRNGRDVRRGRRHPPGSGFGRCRHRHDRAIPAADHASPSGASLVDAGRILAAQGDR